MSAGKRLEVRLCLPACHLAVTEQISFTTFGTESVLYNLFSDVFVRVKIQIPLPALYSFSDYGEI